MDKLMIMSQSRFEELVRNRVSKALIEQNEGMEEDLAQKAADITYLQNQINPHFLYNTLECIRGQALEEGLDDLADTVKALALFYRYNISLKGSVVTFSDELKNLENYIAIQQYRFRNKFTYEVEIEEKDRDRIMNCLLPKLCLQPIVENAIIHAFNDVSTGGRIVLKTSILNGNLSLLINDNGSGMDRETLQKLNDVIHLGAPDSGQRHGVGLRNVHRRIQLMYGEEYGLNVKSSPGKGTFVEVFVPLRMESPHAG